MKRMNFLTCLLVGLLLATAVVPAEARRDERAPREENTRRDGLSLDEAVARARRETGGRVLSAQVQEDRGRTVYRIKLLLPNGSVRVVQVDPQSGATQ